MYEMIPVDETEDHRLPDGICKSLKERFDFSESVLKHCISFSG